MGQYRNYGCAFLASTLVLAGGASAHTQALALSSCEKLLLHILEKPKAYGWMLRRAAERGDDEKIDWLLEQEETSVNTGDRFGFTPLHLAAAYGHLNIVRKLIMAGADARATTWPDRYTPLHSAAERGQAHVVRYFMVERGLSLEADEMGDTPFHTAAQGGHQEVVKLFSQQAQNINTQDKKGLTPLHWAVWQGNADMVQQLIQQGADVNLSAYELKQARARNKKKSYNFINEQSIPDEHAFAYTPLHTAVEKGFASIAQALLEAGADAHTRTEGGSTVLHLAAIVGKLDMAKWALASGVDPNAQNNDGSTALHEAVAREHTDIVDLLKTKTDLYLYDARGHTASQVAPFFKRHHF